MTAWYCSGHLLGDGDESSDKHLVEGLRDGEVELRLVPNLGPLHAADAPLQDRHPSHCDSISIKLVQAGEYQNQVGAGTVMVYMITCTTHEH